MRLNKFLKSLLIIFIISSCSNDDSGSTISTTSCDGTTSVFAINLDTSSCTVDPATDLGFTHSFTESVAGTTRTLTSNSIPDHNVGAFPNSGNPNTISEQSNSFTMTTNPSLASSTTNGAGWVGGILFSGVTAEVYTAEFFVGTTGITNNAWNITTLQSDSDLGLDCNNAHVQPTGSYHYHGSPNAYNGSRSIDGSAMVKVGYAADGFPMYYKYALASDGTTIESLESGYQLSTTDRGGDGITAPSGCPTGLYFQDYEYVSSVSTLDACNGRTGPTPDVPGGEYYYVITDNFPSMPLCFSGTPDTSFQLGP